MPLKIQRDDQTSINLTPMIDIVFLLIIFFMVSTRFGKPQNERDIKLHGDLTDEQRARLMEIADKCPVHRTLSGTLQIRTNESLAATES